MKLPVRWSLEWNRIVDADGVVVSVGDINAIDEWLAEARKATAKAAVDRFLGWKLPADFHPDCGISFDGRGKDARGYDKGWPVGTNLFTADQARAMFEYCLAAIAERVQDK